MDGSESDGSDGEENWWSPSFHLSSSPHSSDEQLGDQEPSIVDDYRRQVSFYSTYVKVTYILNHEEFLPLFNL